MFKVNNKNTRTMSMMYIYDVYMTYTTSRFINVMDALSTFRLNRVSSRT